MLFVALVTSVMLNAQISRNPIDGKVSEFTKLVNSCVSGQRVDKVKLKSLYNEINCSLLEAQAESIDPELVNTREEICGSSEFPRTQIVSDATFKRYALSVENYVKCVGK